MTANEAGESEVDASDTDRNNGSQLSKQVFDENDMRKVS